MTALAEPAERFPWMPADPSRRQLQAWQVKVLDLLLAAEEPIPFEELLEHVPPCSRGVPGGASRRGKLYGWLRWLEKRGAIAQEVRLVNSAALSGVVRLAIRERLEAQMGTLRVAGDDA